MIPQAFEYLAPKTLPEAISLLQQHGHEAKILSGGHSLIPMMKLRLAAPATLIDINGIPGLDFIAESDGFLRIGALTREAALEEAALIRSRYPIIYETAKMIADPQVRNLATVGGNLAHGDPGNDHPATMLALGAQVKAVGPQGERTIPMTGFFVDFFTTALAPDEILTEIQVPIPPAGSGGAYLKLERKVGDYAVAGVAAQVTLDPQGVCRYAGIGLTNVGLVPLKATEAEARLLGSVLDENAIGEAARLAADASDPAADLRGSEAYKRAMVKELTNRALRRAAARARG
jgi:carbon-monoxide dehydrogenase medium subunit